MIDYARQWENDCDDAYDPKTPPERLYLLARGDGSLNRGKSIQRGVASNPSAWASTLMYLAGADDWMVRKFVARNPNATSVVLMRLVEEGDLDVLEDVLLNPNATLEVFAAVADPRVPDPYRREMVAECTRTSVELLMKLAEDEFDCVRGRVAKNPNTPPMVKLWLQSGQYGGMTLQEFLEATYATT